MVSEQLLPIYLFSYGTLQQEKVQLANFGRKLLGKEDCLIGYKLENLKIKDPEVLKKSGTNIHPILCYTDSADDKVSGMVFTISEAELQQADNYEVDDYQRVEVLLESGIKAWVYVENTMVK